MAAPKRKAAESIQKLAARVDQLTSAKNCPRLLHMFIADSPTRVTPGCAKCAEVEAMHAANPAPTSTPRPMPTERRRQMLEDVPTFPSDDDL